MRKWSFTLGVICVYLENEKGKGVASLMVSLLFLPGEAIGHEPLSLFQSPIQDEITRAEEVLE